MDDLDFSLDSQTPTHRSAFRAMVRGIQARILSSNALYEVYDISAHGCSMAAPLHDFTIGTLVDIELEIKGRTLLRGLEAEVARHVPSGLVGFFFPALTELQEEVLDKIILEIQKRQIARARGPFRQTPPL